MKNQALTSLKTHCTRYGRMLFSVFILLALSEISFAGETFKWTGTNSNVWADAGNWQCTTCTLSAIPGIEDHVIFDNTGDYSNGVLINTQAQCFDMTWTLSNSQGATFSGQTGSSLTIKGDLTFVPTPHMTVSFAQYFDLNFTFGGATSRDIFSAGQPIGGVITFNEVGAAWTLLDDLNATYVTYLNKGTVDFNGKNVTTYNFRSTPNTARALDIAGSTWTITGYDIRCLEFKNEGSLTFTSSNSTILFTHPTNVPTLVASGLTFDKVDFGQTRGIVSGDNTFDELAVGNSCQLLKDNVINLLTMGVGSQLILQPSYTQSVGALLANGSCAGHISIRSLWSGTSATIDWTTSNTISASELYVEDVDLTNYTGTPSGVYPMNSTGWGASVPTGNDFYWYGGSGDWDDPAKWSINQSGNSGNCLPGPADNVIFDGPFMNSNISGPHVSTVNIPNAYCANLIWTGTSASDDLQSDETYYNLNVYASLELDPATNMTYDANLRFRSHQSGNQIISAGHTMSAQVYFNGSNGEWSLSDDFHTTGQLYIDGGEFNTSGYSITCDLFNSKPRNPRTIILNNSEIQTEKWDLASHVDQYSYHHTNNKDPYLSFQCGTSEINVNTLEAYTGVEETYHILNMTHANGSQTIWARRCVFEEINFSGNGVLTSPASGGIQSIEVNTHIQFTPGKTYDIIGLVDLGTTGDILAIGTCTSFIDIDGGSFESDGGSIFVDYCIITNNDAVIVNGATFTTANTILTNTTGWLPSSVTGQDFWFRAVSNTECAWSDPDNWYLNATYTTQNGCIPGPYDNVHFQWNSFANQTVPKVEVLTNNAYCRDFIWENPGGNSYPTSPEALLVGTTVTPSSNAQELNVFGSMQLRDASEMLWDYNGRLRMRSHPNSPSIHGLETAGQQPKNRIYFEVDANETVELQDNFTTSGGEGYVYVRSGTFDLAGYAMHCQNFYSEVNTFPRSIDMDNATLTVNSTFNMTPLNLTISTNSTTINMGTGSGIWGYVYSNNLSYPNCTFNFQDNIGVITGSGNTFEDVNFDRDGRFLGSNAFERLTLSPGYTYDFQNGATQTITNNSGNGDLVAVGASGQNIIIRSDLQPNISTIESYVPLCLDHVVMRDMVGDYLLGNDALVAGANSTNESNNSGWAFSECDPILIEGCIAEGALFDQWSTSSAPTWDFGDGSPAVTQFDPTHYYTQAGTYTAVAWVNITVGQAQTTDYRNFEVVITQSCCEEEDFPDHTTVQGTISSNTVWGDQIYVTADVYVTNGATLDITNSDVVFSDATGIYVESGSRLVATNSTLRPCEESTTWSGLSFDEDATGKINNSVVINAEIGASITTTGNVDVIGNQFLNCYKGIYVDAIGTTVGHSITGNDFTLDKDVNNLTYPTTEFYGIQTTGAWFSESISQNEFHYSFISGGSTETYGVHNNSGGLNVTDNQFTNVMYPYVQVDNTNVCAFENNEITYNASFGDQISQSNTEICGVTIESSTMLTSVYGNTITTVAPFVNYSYGIYVNGSPEILVDRNTIEHFTRGIWSDLSSPIITNNVLNDCEVSIECLSTSSLTVNNNDVAQSGVTGILMTNCVEEIVVSNNVIDNEPGSAATGINYYVENGTLGTELISDNCILDCGTSIKLYSVEECWPLPSVLNNYLYTYTSRGIEIWNMEGEIGIISQPLEGKNSFIANNNIATDVFNHSSGICNVDLYGNWPQNVTVNWGMGNVNQVVPTNATTSCGRQVELRLSLGSVKEAYLEDRYALQFQNGNATFTSSTVDFMANLDEARRISDGQAIVRLLLSNDESSMATDFVQTLEANVHLSSTERAWYNYLLSVSAGDWHQSEIALAEAAGGMIQDELLELEKIKVQAYANGEKPNGLSPANVARLEALSGYSNDAGVRDLFHIAEGDHPYVYKRQDIQLPSGGTDFVPSAEVMLSVYPNPASHTLFLKSQLLSDNGSTIWITDILGNVVGQFNVTQAAQQLQVDVSNLKPGTYFVSLEHEEGTINNTFQVIR